MAPPISLLPEMTLSTPGQLIPKQRSHLERCQRRVGRRLENQRVPGQERLSDLPGCELQGEVPGENRRDNAESFPAHLDPLLFVVLEHIERQRPCGCKPEEIRRPSHLFLCLGEWLALLTSESGRQRLGAGLYRRGGGSESIPASLLIFVPVGKRALRCLHGAIQLVGASTPVRRQKANRSRG